MRPLLLALVIPALPLSGLTAELRAPKFEAIDVDTTIAIGYGVAVSDVNGDGRPDILLADKNLYVWYENPRWEKHVLAERLTPQDHVCIAALDIDGDKRCEVAVGAGWNPGDTVSSGAVFSLRAGASLNDRWNPIPLPHEPTVHRMRWVAGEGDRHDLIMLPLHGRGNQAATGEGEGVSLVAYRPPKNLNGPWATNRIQTALHKTHNMDPVQWDQDPEQELLIASKEGVFLLDRQVSKAKLTALSGTESGGAGEVRLGHLTGSRRYFATVEPMHGTNLVIYTDPRSTTPGRLWTRQILDSTLVDGHALACGDLAGMGADQIVVGWRAMGKPGVRVGIKLFLPLDNEGSQWEQTTVDDNQMACEDLCLADLNGDGRLDIVAAGRATKNLKIYFNRGPR